MATVPYGIIPTATHKNICPTQILIHAKYSTWDCNNYDNYTLGITGEAKRKAIRSATEAAEKATRWLWIKRAEPWAIAAGTQAGV